MKKVKLLAALAALSLGTLNASADTTLLTEANGWKKITSISQTDVTSNFYVFVANDQDLMLGLAASTNQGNNGVFYQTSADPVKDVTKVWSIEANGSNYAMRNLSLSGFQIQTEWSSSSSDSRWRTNDQGSSCVWTGLGLAYADGAWALTSTQYSRPLGIYGNGTDTPADGTEIGANDAGNGQKFQIYAISKGDFAAQLLSGASSSNPKDGTALIINNNFGAANGGLGGWTNKSSAGYGSNGAIEVWHKAAWDIYQTLDYLPNGKYQISVQMGAYEDGGDDHTTTTAKFYATGGTTVSGTTNYIGSSPNFAGKRDAFAADETLGKVVLDVAVTNGKLTLGISETSTTSWIVFDNFKLSYLGEDLSAYETPFKEAVEAAKAVDQNAAMNSTVLNALKDAITKYGSVEFSSFTKASEASAATAALANATDAAKNSIDIYAAIAAQYTKFDADGQKAFDATTEGKAYKEKTYTNADLAAAYATAAKAQTTEGADMTLAISNWDFIDCTNDNFTDWNISAPNGGNSWKNGTSSVEYWNGTAANGVFDYSQVITGLPKGRYQLTAKMWNSMNGVSGTFAATSGVYGMTSAGVYTYGLVTDDIDNNSMKEYSTGDIIVNDGQLTVGVKNSTTMVARWFGVDYIKLTYLGNVDFSTYYTAIADLLIKANAITDPQTATATALATAIANAKDYASNTDETALTKIQGDLSTAVEASEASVKAYANAEACLPEMKKLVDATNVYTAEALKAYYTDPAAKFEAKTLTTEEAVALQNPSTVTGWHAAITCDNFLLSAWDTNPDFNNAPYYINTWSVEGANDDSGFGVPFFEYWTNDDKTLAAKTLKATMNGLDAGKYKVTALIRTRINDAAYTTDNTATPTGVTLQVNEGTAVDACGTESVAAQHPSAKSPQPKLFIKEVTAEGEVGSDGTLEIKIIVDGTNVSWLSFKNVKYTLEDTADGISEVAAAENTTASKSIKNGKLVIAKNGKQYNAAGALLK